MKKPTYKHKKAMDELMGIGACLVVAVSFAPIGFGWKLLGYSPYVIGSLILAWAGIKQRCWAYVFWVTLATLLLTVGQASVRFHWFSL